METDYRSTEYDIYEYSDHGIGYDYLVTKNNLTLEIQAYTGYLNNGRVNVKLHYIGDHFYI
eukprot:6408158-Amphidinium_carterae.2